MKAKFRATMMAADTGASEVYPFKAERGLFRRPARAIVRAFMAYMKAEGTWPHATGYKVSSASKKSRRAVVLATGALVVGKGELPFLLMISPDSPASSPR
jgi:hypothetical protein